MWLPVHKIKILQYDGNLFNNKPHPTKKQKKKQNKTACKGVGCFLPKCGLRVFLVCHRYQQQLAGLGGAVGCASDWRPGGRGFDPRRGRQHSFVEIDHEIFSTVILSLPLIQEGQLSVSGERMCTILVNRLED